MLVACRSVFVSMANETARLRARIGKKVCEILGEQLCISFSGDGVLVQPEMERGRSPLASIPTRGPGFSRHGSNRVARRPVWLAGPTL